MNAEDLTEIDRAGRRCGVCHSGRGWRRFYVIRRAGNEPIVLCGSCQARFGENPPSIDTPAPDPTPAPEPVAAKPRTSNHGTERRPDRLRVALRTLPDSFSTATAARVAGLNKVKVRARLREFERRGEIRRVGPDRWSTAAPRDDELASALDRLQARTSNLRIVTHRVG